MAEISPLRRRMIEDMTVRNLSPATRQSYLNPLLKFSRYFGRSPDHLGLEDVHAFQVHLVATGISWPALNQIVCALWLLEPRGPVQEHHLTACEFAKLDRHAGRFVLPDLHCNNSEAGILQLCNEGGTDPGVFDQNRRWRLTRAWRSCHGSERGAPAIVRDALPPFRSPSRTRRRPLRLRAPHVKPLTERLGSRPIRGHCDRPRIHPPSRPHGDSRGRICALLLLRRTIMIHQHRCARASSAGHIQNLNYINSLGNQLNFASAAISMTYAALVMRLTGHRTFRHGQGDGQAPVTSEL